MAKIKISVEGEYHQHSSYDGETVQVAFEESDRYTDSIEIHIEGGHYVHIDKKELKKAIALLCD